MDLSSIINSANTAYAQQSANRASNSDLTQGDFLQLMATQLRSQDPSQPMDPSSFFNQLTQFSMVSGLQGLQSSFNSLAGTLASQNSMRASDLLGHKIEFKSDSAMLDASGLAGAVAVPANATSVTVQIKDATGNVVKTIDLGAPAAGNTDFTWDGRSDAGAQLPPGKYTMSATAIVSGAPQSATTYTTANVQGVTMGANGGSPMVDVGDLGQIPLSAVFEVV
jgi:flagellar basal-body rod modification protein FlgD